MKQTIKANISRFALHEGRQKGQILLIMVMIMAIAITMVLTITFTSRTDTQLTKLEEENQKALAAAEAGIESSLKNNASIGALANVGSLGNTISSGRVDLTTAASNTFTSANVISGEAYTVYLGSYTPGSPPTFGNSNGGADVTICFGDSGSVPVLDIALVKDPTAVPAVKRYLADYNNQFGGGNKLSVSSSCAINSSFSYSVLIPRADISTNTRLLVVRSLMVNTKLFISYSGLPSQGRTVTSQATTRTGVTKKVQLFQSYPQIPAEFFFTSF